MCSRPERKRRRRRIPAAGMLLAAGVPVADLVDVQYREWVRDEERLRVRIEARKRAILGCIRLDVDWQMVNDQFIMKSDKVVGWNTLKLEPKIALRMYKLGTL